MKRLIILRHATADWNQPGRSDFERRLDPEGELEAVEMGRRLAAAGLIPQRIVTSPADRALTTARLAAAELGIDNGEFVEDEALYNAPLQTLLDVVGNLDDCLETVMVVAHNPGLSELGRYLTGHSGGLPPAGCYVIDFELEQWGELWRESGSLTRFDYPTNG